VLVVIAFRAVPLTSFLPSPACAGNKKKTGRARACSAGFAIRSTRRVGDQEGVLRRASLHLRLIPQYRDGEPGVKTPPSWPSSSTYYNYIGLPSSGPRRPTVRVRREPRAALEGPSEVALVGAPRLRRRYVKTSVPTSPAHPAHFWADGPGAKPVVYFASLRRLGR